MIERLTRSRWRDAHPARRGRSSQRVDHPEPAAANAEALHDLENGATGLSLVFAGAVGAYGYGLAATDDAITRALDGVHLDAGIAIDSISVRTATMIATRLAALVKRRGTAPAATDIRFGFDPIGAAAAAGGGRAVLERARAGLQRRHFRFGRQRLCRPFALRPTAG